MENCIRHRCLWCFHRRHAVSFHWIVAHSPLLGVWLERRPRVSTGQVYNEVAIVHKQGGGRGQGQMGRWSDTADDITFIGDRRTGDVIPRHRCQPSRQPPWIQRHTTRRIHYPVLPSMISHHQIYRSRCQYRASRPSKFCAYSCAIWGSRNRVLPVVSKVTCLYDLSLHSVLTT